MLPKKTWSNIEGSDDDDDDDYNDSDIKKSDVIKMKEYDVLLSC